MSGAKTLPQTCWRCSGCQLLSAACAGGGKLPPAAGGVGTPDPVPRPGAGLTFSTPAQEAQALGVLRASARAQSLAQELLEQAGSCRASLLELETRTPGVGGTEGTCPRPWRGARLITTSWLMCNGTAWLCLGHGEAPPWGLQAAGPSSGCPDPKEKGGSSAWRPSGSPRRCLGGSWTVPGAAKG